MIIANLGPFMAESLMLARMPRPATDTEKVATQKFLELRKLTIEDVLALQAVYEPKAPLRDKKDMDAQIGNHTRGGPAILRGLKMIIAKVNRSAPPFEVHCEFETLHPFMAGNGLMGRAIWAWQMIQRLGADEALAQLFLQRWYFQSLENADGRA